MAIPMMDIMQSSNPTLDRNNGNPITKFVVPIGPTANLIVLRDLSELWKSHLASSLRALGSLTALIIIAGYLSRHLLRFLASDSRMLQEISSLNKIPSKQYSMHTKEAQETSGNLMRLRELMESYASDSRLSRDIIKDISSFIPIVLLMYEKTRSAATPKLLFRSNDAPFGMPEIATRPHRIMRRMHPRDRAALTSALRQLRRQGVCAVDFRVHMPTGEWCFLNMRLVRSEVKEGVLRYSVMLADRNAWYLDGGASSNSGIALLGRMSAGLAHELNQPLNVISLAVDAVEARREMTDGSEFSNYVAQRLARIREQNDRASEIINTVGSLAKLTPGVLVDSDAGDSIRRAVEICSAELRRCRIDLDLALASQVDLFVVRVDPDGLCRVIVNLILNAIDAIHDEGNEDRGLIRISISAWPDIGQISIDVTDNGPGFEPHALENLFVPFFTLKQPGRRAGLGLASSYAAVKNWGGDITAKNLQRGAQVSVYLPDPRSAAAGDGGIVGAGITGAERSAPTEPIAAEA